MTLFVICLLWFAGLIAAAYLPIQQRRRVEKGLFTVAWFLVVLVAIYLGPLGGVIALLAVLSAFQSQIRTIARWYRIKRSRLAIPS